MSDGKFPLSGMIAHLKGKKSLLAVAAALVIGIVLMIFGGASEEKPTASAVTAYSGTAELEGRVEALCERVIGTAEVSVMITLDNYGERIYACDERSVKGASGNEVLREYVIASGELVSLGDEAPRVRGIAVVCRGGDDAVIKLRLTEMLCALFDIPSSSVSIMGAKS